MAIVGHERAGGSGGHSWHWKCWRSLDHDGRGYRKDSGFAIAKPETIAGIIRRLVDFYQPVRIDLFGSEVRG